MTEHLSTSKSLPYESPNRFEHWDEMEKRVDAFLDLVPGLIEARGQGRAALEGLLAEFRHVIRYARDAEAGNAELRRRMSENVDMPPDPHNVPKSGQKDQIVNRIIEIVRQLVDPEHGPVALRSAWEFSPGDIDCDQSHAELTELVARLDDLLPQGEPE